MTIISIVIFALILSFLVLIHELGHFLVARLCKIKVEEFGLGYPPLAKKLFRKNGTDFTLNWIPFGGFVRMKGEMPDEDGHVDHDADSFNEQSARKRLLVIVAGAAVNIIFGVLAFSAVFSAQGIPSGALISQIQPDSPAAQAGLQPMTAIVGLETPQGHLVISSVNDAVTLIGQFPGQQITIDTIGPCSSPTTCESQTQSYPVTLRILTVDQIKAGDGSLGVEFDADYAKFYPWYIQPFKGVEYGIEQAVSLGISILTTLASMIWQLGTKGIIPQDLAGPVGIVDQANQSGIFSAGIWAIVFFAGLLSINLGVMNVLPIPALDGGRALFVVLEKIIGKKRVEKFEGYANNIGFSVLIILIVLISARDVFRIFHKG